MSTSSQTTDYGEPWSASDKALYQRDGPLASFMITAEMAERVVQCVNACSGMEDPAAEIQAMREAIKLGQACMIRLQENGHSDGCLSLRFANAGCDCGVEAANAAVAKLKPFTTP